MHRASRERKKLPPWLMGLIIAILVFAAILLVANLLGLGDEPTIGVAQQGHPQAGTTSLTQPNPRTETSGSQEEPVTSIPGYGDYSDYSYEELDGDEIEALVLRCLQDQGFPVVPIEGGGIDFGNVPPEQSAQAEATFDACMAGLNLPPPGPPSREFIENLYYSLVAVEECLEGLGYEIEDPPSLETFIDTYDTGPWHPYLSLPLTAPHADLEEACPVE